jgi:hypothetical protein
MRGRCGRPRLRVAAFSKKTLHAGMDALIAGIHNKPGMSSTDKWRRELRIWVTWAVLAKIAALAVIWALFFHEGAS